MNFNLSERTILLTVGGSHAYGIATPSSDLDVKGICIAPPAYTLGIETFEQADKPEHFKRDDDIGRTARSHPASANGVEGTIYDLRKFVRLALDANPNILDLLFCDDRHVLISSTYSDILRGARGLFLSTKCKHTFSGYAMAQLKRIKSHRRWLLTPPTHAPTRAEHDLPEHTLIPADQLAAATALVQKQCDSWEFDLSCVPDESARIEIMARVRATQEEILNAAGIDRFRAAARFVGIDDNLLLVLERERRYKAAQTEWHQFKHWQSTRNPARAALEAQHGYDTKHAAHLVRLMRMCIEIMLTGAVNVDRTRIDAEELRAIRAGAWSYDCLVDFAERADAFATEIYQNQGTVYPRLLPKTPDRERVNALCVDLHVAKGM